LLTGLPDFAMTILLPNENYRREGVELKSVRKGHGAGPALRRYAPTGPTERP